MPGAYRAGWVADWPTPDNYLKNLFYTAAVGTSANDFGYSNTDVDKLIDQAISEQDLNTANELYQQAQARSWPTCRSCRCFWGGDSFYKESSVNNLQVTPFDIVLYAGISTS